jgi:DNA topoisomerase IA
LDEADKYKVERITFNEITESAVKKALQHPRKIDIN